MTHWTTQSDPLKTVELGPLPPLISRLSSSRKLPVWPHWGLTWCQSDFAGFAFYSFGRIRSSCNLLCVCLEMLWTSWVEVGLPLSVLVVCFHSFVVVFMIVVLLGTEFLWRRGIL